MGFSVIIPARYSSTRLPQKLLADLGGKPLIWHVAVCAAASEAESVLVATDDDRIAQALNGAPCKVVMTSAEHQSGSDRLAEVVRAQKLPDSDIVVNVQGDEPTIPARLINEVAACLEAAPNAAMATAAQAIDNVEDWQNPNIVKVVLDQFGRAMYFSRAAIPYSRNSNQLPLAWHHIGIYAYRAGFLRRYSALQASDLEQIESLEQLRVLDNGESIMVHTIDYDAGIGVDTAADLERARKIIELQAVQEGWGND